MSDEYEYTELTTEQKIQGIRTRIGELEGQHWSNTVYAEEALEIGDVKASEHFLRQNKPLEKRLRNLLAKLERLNQQLEEEVVPEENEPAV